MVFDFFSVGISPTKCALDLVNTSVTILYQKVGGSKVPPATPTWPGFISNRDVKVVAHVLQNWFVQLYPLSLINL